MSIETALRHAAQERSLPADFYVELSDMHGLWGGTRQRLFLNGRLELEHRQAGNAPPELALHEVGREAMHALAALLVDIRAWDESLPSRLMIPDETSVSLLVVCGGAMSSFFEPAGEMPKTARLSRVTAWFAAQTADGARPLEAPSPRPPLPRP